MSFVLFDSLNRDALLPIVYMRPVGTIRVGMLTLQEKWEHFLKKPTSFLVPVYLSNRFQAEQESLNVYINAAVIPSKDLITEILKLQRGQKLIQNENLLAFVSTQISWEDILLHVNSFTAITYEANVKIISKTWDIISFLKEQLLDDFKLNNRESQIKNINGFATLISPGKIIVGKNVKIGACILNASEGDIVIDDNAEIHDGAIVKGPVYLGENSTINMGAKIHGPVSIGNNCKVGGEVCDSVLQAYSNKGHDGFLGHSYIGEWCNMGAGTNTSNLKNTYDKVRIWNYATGKFDHTQLQFLGTIMGDHSKTGINTMLNTGTVIGVATNVFGAGFPRNFMPDFTIGGPQKMEVFNLKLVCRMAKAMMVRRNIELSESEEKIFEYIFEQTIKYRKY